MREAHTRGSAGNATRWVGGVTPVRLGTGGTDRSAAASVHPITPFNPFAVTKGRENPLRPGGYNGGQSTVVKYVTRL